VWLIKIKSLHYGKLSRHHSRLRSFEHLLSKVSGVFLKTLSHQPLIYTTPIFNVVPDLLQTSPASHLGSIVGVVEEE